MQLSLLVPLHHDCTSIHRFTRNPAVFIHKANQLYSFLFGHQHTSLHDTVYWQCTVLMTTCHDGNDFELDLTHSGYMRSQLKLTS